MTPDRPFRAFVNREHVTHVLAFMALSVALIIGVRYGTLAVSSPASTCAVGQARMLVDDQKWLSSPLPRESFPPDLSGMLAPLGFVALNDGSGRAVPGCPAGLSFVMAAAMRVGGDPAVFLLVPLFGVLAVWSTYLLGRTIAGPWAAVAATSLLVCSPLFMSGVIQPLSDVPAAALWAACLAASTSTGDGSGAFRFRRAIGTGLLAGLAVMVRPHLFPLAIVPVMLVARGWEPVIGRGRDEAVSRRRLVAATVIGMIPGVAATASLQWRIYGSVVGSAATAADGTVGLAQAAVNMASYAWWLGRLHTPVLVLAFLAPLVAWQDKRRLWPLVAFVLGVWGLEGPYGSVTGWQHAVAVVPALPVLIVLTVAAASSLSSRLGPVWRPIALLIIVAMVGGSWILEGRARGIFEAKATERKYREVGRYAARSLPPEAVVLAALPGGSIRYYAETPTLTWSAIPANRLDALLDNLRSRGYVPFLALDASERDAFGTHFRGHTMLADLDWPARITIGRDISIYDPLDRARHLAGENIPTESVSWPR
jgi:hypothetical protein